MLEVEFIDKYAVVDISTLLQNQDPDPAPWLEVTPEMKVNNQKKPYGESTTIESTTIRTIKSTIKSTIESTTAVKILSSDGKKSCWVPDKTTGGYLEGLCENDMKVLFENM